ncbi:SDR family NAD(P)-dependent oxidoreductase [Micromonospora sp. NPDC050495]|uniref:SDR family NAD(P)-dependent oxidoreductase n=1 Tax=Micromonospora sp. NPDC050495 TaxID=3154936 RepID=UPI0034075EB0
MTGTDGQRIAIVGIAARVPSASGPEEYWRLLRDGTDTIRRRDPRRPYGPERGGFVDGVEEFDADFFHLSPREAAATDPQQRLALEMAWHAMEDAGVAVTATERARVGVFLGVMAADYADLVAMSGEVGRHTLTGVSRALIANRVSHALRFDGPSMTVDSGQSSSLVAVHLACESLRRGEAEVALAGGIHLNVSPRSSAAVAAAGALSPDGRCFVFDERANGYVRGEGGGLVVLKPLARAVADGDRIYAVIEGSAVRTGSDDSGLSVPSAEVQAQTIGEALSRAGLRPDQVQYVELHGTGTPVGDPIEAEALGAAYGRSRRTALVVGSVKTNIGHLEGAAGIAGLIKTALCVHRRELVPQLNFVTPNPRIPLDELGLRVATRHEPWPADGEPIAAGVTSLGIGGSCCHLVLTAAPLPVRADRPAPEAPLGVVPLVVSGRGGVGLRAQAGGLRGVLVGSGVGVVDVGFSAAVGRAQLGSRAVVVGAGRGELVAGLSALVAGESVAGVVEGRSAAGGGGVVFVFPGQGGQWERMAVELLDSSPVFAAELGACGRALSGFVDWRVEDVLRGVVGAPSLERVDVVQPVLFAVMVALAGLWRSVGVRPSVVVGHSQGEIAAACVAGVLSLEDAARVVALRSQVVRDRLAGAGAMVSVGLPVAEVGGLIAPFGGRVSVAAVNGPSSVVVAGEVGAVDEVMGVCERRGVRARRVPVDYASHSAQVEVVREELLRVLGPVRPRSGGVPLFSTVCGRFVDPVELGAEYWYRNLREPVGFEPAVRALVADGASCFVEVSPHPVLTVAVQEVVQAVGVGESVAVVGSLRRGEGGGRRFVTSVAEAFVAGVGVDWSGVFAGSGAVRVDLPGYAFARQRYWLSGGGAVGDVVGAGLRRVGHPLLVAAVPVGDGGQWVFTGRLSVRAQPWLADHVVFGSVVVPGAVLVELAAAAGGQLGVGLVEELVLHTPLVLGEHTAVQVQVQISPPDPDHHRREIGIYSHQPDTSMGDGSPPTCHARGYLRPADDRPHPWRPTQWPPAGATPIDADLLYARLGAAGYDHGPAFQALRSAWQGDDQAVYADLALTDEQAEEATGYDLHPALLDAALHGRLALRTDGAETGGTPYSWSGLRVSKPGAVRARARLARSGPAQLRVDLVDEDGVPLAAVDTVDLRPLDAADLDAARPVGDLCQLDWVPVPHSGTRPGSGASVVLLGDGVPGDGERYPTLPAIEQAIAEGTAVPEVVVAAVADPGQPDGRTPAGHALTLAQRWLASPRLAGTRLVLVTHRAVAIGDEAPDPLAAAAYGLVRTAQAEHPGRFVLVDLAGDAGQPDWAALADLDEPQLAVRHGRLLAARLTRVGPPRQPAAPMLDGAGTVLVTGGAGGTSTLLARHLVRVHQARHLVLVNRPAPADDEAPDPADGNPADPADGDTPGRAEDGAAGLGRELTALGCRVDVVTCDLASRDQVANLLATLDRPLTAVVHAADVPDEGTLESLSPDRIDHLVRTEADVARHLHELTEALPLAAFVLLTSATAWLGTPGQAGHAAVHAYLNALAARRHAAGLPATALAWGPLRDDTTGDLDQAAAARWARAGLRPLPAGPALDLFDRAGGYAQPVLAPVGLDRAALRQQARDGGLPTLFADLVPAPARRTAPEPGSLAGRLSGLPPARRDRAILDVVRAQMAAVLGHSSPGAIDPLRTFKELGIDSLGGVELRDRLTRTTGLALPSTLVFDHPTGGDVARLLGRLAAGADHDTDRSPAPPRPETTDEPLAIVGIGCRYPGGIGSPEEFWTLLAEGGDAISELPRDRGWDLERLYHPEPDRAGTLYTRGGGFLPDAADFDADFFGISPREALATDPQQRLMLEASWHAFEDAGIDPTSLRGSDTGVFCGVMSSDDYGAPGAAELEGFRLAGTTNSVVSGRVAYTLGLEGPAITVDTACSSSLVALHLAAQALRNRECSLALAAGVTVMAKPFLLVEFSRQRGLSADGRCRPYAAAADGTGFSEGLGVLVLERLSDARRNGRRIWGVVRGSAINQDGASNGLTAPNGPSQERVIAQALANAGLAPADVDAVEGHGTGTRLGDPIEAQALLATYGRDRVGADPLWLGSVKSNIGHTQAAAGIAGVIKMVLAMRHELLPRTLHVDAPSPHVDWNAGQVRLLTEPVPWPASERPRRAGVSSFGISGTNAHVILEDPPRDPAADDRPAPEAPLVGSGLVGAGVVPLVVSGRGGVGLRAQAGGLRGVLVGSGVGVVDVGFSAAVGRAQLGSRAVVVGAGRGELVAGLSALVAGESVGGVVEGRSAAGGGGVVFVFPGQGGQWERMAVELLDSSPVFAAELGACGRALSGFVDWRVEDVLRGVVGAPSLERVDVVQPVLFAVMVALAGLWRSVGVRPSVVVGHSQGEIAAACVAGVLSLEDAARVVALRSQVVRDRLAGAGAMVSVGLPVAEVGGLIAPFGGRVSVAAVNGPSSVVVAGEVGAVDEVMGVCERRGVRARRVPVDYASHSAQVEVVREELLRVLGPVRPRSGGVPLFSTVCGRFVDPVELGAEYWYRNLREPVGFEPAVRALVADGASCFVEVSPHPVLTVAVQEVVQAVGVGESVAVVGSLRRGEGGGRRFVTSVAEAFVAGVGVDWSGVFAGSGAVRVDLPGYAFARQRYWLSGGGAVGDVVGAGLRRVGHPLLVAAVPVGDGGQWVFTGRLSVRAQPWLADHVVFGSVVVPGAVLVELAAAAGGQLGVGLVEELVLHTPLVLGEHTAVQVQVQISPPDPDHHRREVTIYSRPEQQELGDGATRHARGFLREPDDTAPAWRPTHWPPLGAEPVPVEDLYLRLLAAGYEYGPVFQGVRAAWRDGSHVYTELAVPDDACGDGHAVHPVLLDAALHGTLLDKAAGSATDLPFSWSGVHAGNGRVTRARARIALAPDGAASVDIVDDTGEPVASVARLVSRPIDRTQLDRMPADPQEFLFHVQWRAAADPTPAAAVRIAAVGAAVDGIADRYPDLAALDRAMAEGQAAPDLVIAAIDGDGDGTAAGHAAARQALTLVQGWLAASWSTGVRLLVATRNAIATGGEPVNLAQSPVWGLLRSVQSEHPGRFGLVDLDRDGGQPAWAALADLGEPQLAVRAGRPLVPRLQRAAPVPAGDGWRLTVGRAGSLEDLTIGESDAHRPLAAHEVRLAVRAAGVNFRDLVVTLGMVPGLTGLGAEAAGVVLEVGSGVSDLAPGDRVMGLVLDSFGAVAVAQRRMLVPMPAGFTFAQAAAVPVTYLTAYYGLVDVAGVRPGDRVLVHAAAGGVGMAAVQLATHLGAQVFATASPAKWPAVRALGVDEQRIASSRELAFREQFLGATDGAGMDVVLNALAGEFADASLDLLPRGGRFVELGKTDIRDAADVAAAYPGVRYRAFDLFDVDQDRIQQLLQEVLALFERGVLRHAPVRAWDMRDGREALRFLREGRNVGKIVLTAPAPLDPDGTVLLTGGTGGLGATVAKHLAGTHQVKRLLLVSRRGPAAPGAGELVDELAALGAEARVVACDAADRRQLAELLDSLEHPVTAVVHAAGVLDDGVVESLTPERLERVMRPKLDAARHLHELTAGRDLSAFVLFSSVAATMGNGGQGNYAAANAYLDALAAQRRAAGLPATSIAWGLWADATGMTGELGEADRARLARSGIATLPTDLGLRLFDQTMGRSEALLVPVRLDFAALRVQAGTAALTPLLRDLVRAPAQRTRRTTGSLAERLAGVAPAEREQVTLDLVRAQVAAVLGHAAPEAVDAGRAFKEVGFDSLAAVELRNRLSRTTGLSLPTTLIFDHPNPAAVTAYLLGTIGGADAASGSPLERELRQVEALLSELAGDAQRLAEAEPRLRAFGNRLRHVLSGAAGHHDEADAGTEDGLGTVSDEDLFTLIDRELGSA